MKKFLTLVLGVTLSLGLTACTVSQSSSPSVEQDSSKTIKVQSLDANRQSVEVEVPYNPQRVAILDMPALDIIDALGVGDRVVGSAKTSIEYLSSYNPEKEGSKIVNLGTIKTADLEKVAACNPDVIFIGGRLSSIYKDLEAIAPVVFLGVDYEKGIVESTKNNAQTIASIFGKEAEVESLFTNFQSRISKLNSMISGKNVVLGMYNSNTLGLMGNQSQLGLIGNELGANNIGETVGEKQKATHGEEASWETITALNPEYLFVLDRSTATGSTDENSIGAKEVIENDLIKELNVYKEGKIIYFIKNANVWYTSAGGIKALDTMLTDLEEALLK